MAIEYSVIQTIYLVQHENLDEQRSRQGFNVKMPDNLGLKRSVSAGAAQTLHGSFTWGNERLVCASKLWGRFYLELTRIEREFRVNDALQRCRGFPVLGVFAGENETVLGAPFYMMGGLSGGVLSALTLPGMTQRERAATY